jgi:DNA-binding GntR family transcriptional regulator
MNDPKAETRTQKLSSDVADAILRGEFEPGARLDEQMLATRFGVSRTPVREVLRELAASGLVEMRPRRGAIVTRVTVHQLDTLFGAMAELEATCARLAAVGMTQLERRRLEALHEQMGELVSGGDEEAYAQANLRFHNLIYEGCHNDVLIDMATGLRRRLGPFRRAQFHTSGRLSRSHVEHAAVVDAVLGADAGAAHAAMLRHVSLVEDAYERLAAGDATTTDRRH